MTVREFYDAVLVEQNKVEAPALLLEDFIYIANKAVQQYINQVYNRFDTTQQSSDDLRVLQKTAIIDILKEETELKFPGEFNIRRCILPEDYFHILNCVVYFDKVGKSKKDSKCPSKNDEKPTIYSMARRLTADQFPTIIRNAYFKPSYKCPYFYINNINDIDNDPHEIKMEIRCGDDSIYSPTKVYIDYLRKPKRISLTWDDINGIDDKTDKMEFPDYVCYEIVNECVKLILENTSDPRMQTNYAVNKTVGSVTESASGK